MMIPSCFITGTDTDAGKTVVTASLLRYLSANKVSSTGLKPIASGFEEINGYWRNHDIEALKQASAVELPDSVINLYGFKPAIAPHIAAQDSGVSLDFGRIKNALRTASQQADVVLVEGVGGWRVPLSHCGPECRSPCGEHTNTIATLAKYLELPVILVVGLKLGCLNHALLTAEAIIDEGLHLLGWVGNNILPDFNRAEENLATLRQLMPAPMLFEMPYLHDSTQLEAYSPDF